MSEDRAETVRGVLVAHGDMARGMIDAVRRIAGVDEHAVVPLSNDGRSPEALRAELTRLAGRGPAVVFTDLQAGSCAFAAMAACGRAHTAVVCGVNLPMLLDFVFHRDLPFDELVDRVVSRGKDGIRAMRMDAAAGRSGADAQPSERRRETGS